LAAGDHPEVSVAGAQTSHALVESAWPADQHFWPMTQKPGLMV